MMCIFLFLFLVPFLLKWLNAKLINRKAVSAGFLLLFSSRRLLTPVTHNKKENIRIYIYLIHFNIFTSTFQNKCKYMCENTNKINNHVYL